MHMGSLSYLYTLYKIPINWSNNLTVTFMIFSINSDPTSIYQIYDFDLPFAMICSKLCGWSHLQVRTCTREGACRTCPFWLVLKLLLSEHEMMT